MKSNGERKREREREKERERERERIEKVSKEDGGLWWGKSVDEWRERFELGREVGKNERSGGHGRSGRNGNGGLNVDV